MILEILKTGYYTELYKSFSSFDYVQEVMIPWTLALSLIFCWMESFCEYRSINTLKTEEYPRLVMSLVNLSHLSFSMSDSLSVLHVL